MTRNTDGKDHLQMHIPKPFWEKFGREWRMVFEGGVGQDNKYTNHSPIIVVGRIGY